MAGGANGMSLIDAQADFQRTGGAPASARKYARPPRVDEAREPGWRPIDPSVDLTECSSDLAPGWDSEDGSDTAHNDMERLYWWRDTYWRRGKAP